MFAVKSQLQLDLKTATFLSVIFFVPFSFMRFLLIFLSLHLSPIIILLLSLVLSSFGSLTVILFGDSFLVGLQAGTAMLGLGIASLFSGAFIWFQTKVTLNNKIGGVFTFFGSAGAQIFLSCASQFIEDEPRALPYSILVSMLVCTSLLGVAVLITRTQDKKDTCDRTHESKELMYSTHKIKL